MIQLTSRLHNRYDYVGSIGDSTQPREVVTQCPAAALGIWSMDRCRLSTLAQGHDANLVSRSRLARGDTGLRDGSDRCDGAERIKLVRCGDRRDLAICESEGPDLARCPYT
jgi:hypothetical protein